mmetsp:Transcript_30674/g.76759  ORF Transcript_30674/g.76759 Transcript_30674/m.76759 type:complete len:210 (+) Transcript_30674:935-1564(+)
MWTRSPGRLRRRVARAPEPSPRLAVSTPLPCAARTCSYSAGRFTTGCWRTTTTCTARTSWRRLSCNGSTIQSRGIPSFPTPELLFWGTQAPLRIPLPSTSDSASSSRPTRTSIRAFSGTSPPTRSRSSTHLCCPSPHRGARTTRRSSFSASATQGLARPVSSCALWRIRSRSLTSPPSEWTSRRCRWKWTPSRSICNYGILRDRSASAR